MEMIKGSLYRQNQTIYKVLHVQGEQVLVIDCIKATMPKWIPARMLPEMTTASADDVLSVQNRENHEGLSDKELAVAHQRYSMIAGILPFIEDDKMRNRAVSQMARTFEVSRRTITTYLCKYLIYEDIAVLANKHKEKPGRELTADEKNFRWALNNFYYTRHKNSLMESYIQMLKEKYCDSEGKLIPDHPSIYQFRYFYHKTRKIQTELISREGLKEYQLNYRPLLGDGVQEMAHAPGWGMLDATVCDIYLVDDGGHLVGRPVLQVCVDAYSGICCGYSLLWEGGIYSVRELMLNTLSDKVTWCRKFGVAISTEQWNCKELPGVIVTDRGSEYISYNFEQITELGCQVISLPPFSANLKGPVEKLFDLVQDSFKPYLKGKGVVESDFRKRGVKDYRQEACLTMEMFEKIILRCVIYHNSQRVLKNFPYTRDMLDKQIPPYSNTIWEYGKTLTGANLIQVSREKLVMTLLPRTVGKFTRKGLVVNNLRYDADGFTEDYLRGESVIVAYNPDDVSYVYLIKSNKHLLTCFNND